MFSSSNNHLCLKSWICFMYRSSGEWLRRRQWSDQLWLGVWWHSAGGSTCWCELIFSRKNNPRPLFCWTCQICSRRSTRCCYRYVSF